MDSFCSTSRFQAVSSEAFFGARCVFQKVRKSRVELYELAVVPGGTGVVVRICVCNASGVLTAVVVCWGNAVSLQESGGRMDRLKM